jgi:hypothetical protein
MSDLWNEARILRMIVQQEPEGLSLEYKGSGTVGKNNDQRDDITKAVSAMANSRGGIVIFGVAPYRDPNKKDLPERIDPIDQTQYSQEWLGQKIGLISPRIAGIEIYPIPLASSPSTVIYVVDIPQGVTAHQATDQRYYRRFDARSVPMYDHEIRDVMNRATHPKIELTFSVEVITKRVHSDRGELVEFDSFTLYVHAENIGAVYAQYVNAFIDVPFAILPPVEMLRKVRNVHDLDGQYGRLDESNVMAHHDRTDSPNFPKYRTATLGSPTYHPMLPKVGQQWSIELNNYYLRQDLSRYFIRWTTHADNALPYSGEISLSTVPLEDSRNKQ